MQRNSEIRVTLSDELLDVLQAECEFSEYRFDG